MNKVHPKTVKETYKKPHRGLLVIFQYVYLFVWVMNLLNDKKNANFLPSYLIRYVRAAFSVRNLCVAGYDMIIFICIDFIMFSYFVIKCKRRNEMKIKIIKKYVRIRQSGSHYKIYSIFNFFFFLYSCFCCVLRA